MEYFESEPNEIYESFIKQSINEIDVMNIFFTDVNISESAEWFTTFEKELSDRDTTYIKTYLREFGYSCLDTSIDCNILPNLSWIIRMAPNCSDMLSEALNRRAIIFLQKSKIDLAVMDIEAIFDLNRPIFSRDNAYEYKNHPQFYSLLISYYIEKLNKDKAVQFFDRFKLFNELNGREARIELQLNNLLDRLKILPENDLNNFSQKHTPYIGFTTKYKKIHGASVACTFFSKQDQHYILANRVIPKESIVMIDKPICYELLVPDFQCEYCLKFMEYSLPCSNCHWFNYCSVQCRNADRFYHNLECYGYKLGIIQILDAKLPLRLLIQCIYFMEKYFLNFPEVKSIETAGKLFELLKTKSNGDEYGYYTIFNVKPEFEKLNVTDLKSFVQIALKLSTYIQCYTNFLNEICCATKLSEFEAHLFIALVTLRHCVQIKNKVCNIRVNQNTHVINETNGLCNISQHRFNEINYQQIVRAIENLSFSSNTSYYQRDIIRNGILQTIEDYQSSELKTEICCLKHYTLMTMFEKLFTITLFPKEFQHQIIRSVYPILTLLEHSSDPNLVITYTSDGQILLKACKEIKFGERITISYSGTYKKSTVPDKEKLCNHVNCDEQTFFKIQEENFSDECGECNYKKILKCYLLTDFTNSQKKIIKRFSYLDLYDILIKNWVMCHVCVDGDNILIYYQLFLVGKVLVLRNHVADSYEVFELLGKWVKKYFLISNISNEYLAYIQMLIQMFDYNQLNNIDFFNENIKLFYLIYKLIDQYLIDLIDSSKFDLVNSYDKYIMNYSEKLIIIKKNFNSNNIQQILLHKTFKFNNFTEKLFNYNIKDYVAEIKNTNNNSKKKINDGKNGNKCVNLNTDEVKQQNEPAIIENYLKTNVSTTITYVKSSINNNNRNNSKNVNENSRMPKKNLSPKAKVTKLKENIDTVKLRNV